MMYKQIYLSLMVLAAFIPDKLFVTSGGAPGDTIGSATGGNRYNAHVLPSAEQQQQQHHRSQLHSQHSATHLQQQHQQQHHHSIVGVGGSNNAPAVGSHALYHASSGGGHPDHRNSYNLLSEAMSQAVSNEFSNMGSGSADGACHVDDLDCYSGNVQDRLGMEAIRTLHRQLDDDDNGNIDLSESDDFLREELKYDSGYQNRQKTFHFNDDKHISVKELWEAWLRSEVHNWTIEQTTDWLAQSVQLPQYVDLFKQHKVIGAALPRLAVNNMHYVSNVLGIKDPIHKQKIALKAMDVVLFGPPRETGTRWKDYILVILLLSAIIGCWYAYQQNKNAKRHLRRMAQDMEGLQRAEQSLQEMQKELERARMEQENVATEKLDLERRLKEAPSLSSSNSDLEVQKLKKEIEMLRTELSRAEIELVDNCWSPPPQLQSWLQYTYELENKQHMKKRISAEKQLQSAREACEKLRKKRSSLVGAFVSTHGKSIDDVDRSIVEARNSLSEVTNELQERLHRWKQIETCLGLNIVNNNGFSYLESVLYGRGNGVGSTKSSRGRMTNSTDDLDDESVQAKCSDPKVQTWCRWKSIHTSQNKDTNQMLSFAVLAPNSQLQTTHRPQQQQQQMLQAQLQTKELEKWLNNTAQLANSPHLPHRHPSNLHHQQRAAAVSPKQSPHLQEGMTLMETESNISSCSSTSSKMSHTSTNNSTTSMQRPSLVNKYQAPSVCSLSVVENQNKEAAVRPPPPHLRRLLRRHTVIPKWRTSVSNQQSAIAPVPMVESLKRGAESCVFPSVEKNHHHQLHKQQTATTKLLYSSQSDGCLLNKSLNMQLNCETSAENVKNFEIASPSSMSSLSSSPAPSLSTL